MTTALALALAVPTALLAALAVLTGAGSRRRGAGWAVSGLSGLFFPLAWVAWYVRDRRAAQRALGAGSATGSSSGLRPLG